MLDGNFKHKTQVGMHISEDVHRDRKIGERWFDSDGKEWEQKQGYRSSIKNTPEVGLGDNCSNEDCGKLILKKWDKDTYKADDKPIRWFAYRRLKDFRNQKSIEKEMVQWVEEFEKMRNQNPFDEKVANALANGEVEMSIKKNT